MRSCTAVKLITVADQGSGVRRPAAYLAPYRIGIGIDAGWTIGQSQWCHKVFNRCT